MKTPGLYLAFAWGTEFKEVDELHCTYKFFGKQSTGTIGRIIAAVDMIATEVPLPCWTFTEEKFFGPKEDLRVLTPIRWVWTPDEWARLREKLCMVQPDDFQYSPHVTSPSVKRITHQFTHLVLVSKWGVIGAWKGF